MGLRNHIGSPNQPRKAFRSQNVFEQGSGRSPTGHGKSGPVVRDWTMAIEVNRRYLKAAQPIPVPRAEYFPFPAPASAPPVSRCAYDRQTCGSYFRSWISPLISIMVEASLPVGLSEAERRRRLFERIYGADAAGPRWVAQSPAKGVSFPEHLRQGSGRSPTGHGKSGPVVRDWTMAIEVNRRYLKAAQ